jgi:hypothetical protein
MINAKNGKHPLYESHDTTKCRIHQENKTISKYLDTCANKTVYGKKPNSLQSHNDYLTTANGEMVDITGKGKDTIQNLELDEVYYAPELTHNSCFSLKIGLKSSRIQT